MLNRVTRVTPLSNYRLTVEFQDGVYGTIDLSDRLFGEMFEPLRDVALFHQVSIDKYGAISWPNGADLAPDALHRTLILRRFPALGNHRPAAEDTMITNDEGCIEQLLEAFVDLADRDDIRRASERLLRVQEWIRRQAQETAEQPEKSVSRRANR
jgi:hypothetical protein